MIPGEYFLDDEPIEINAGRADGADRGHQSRRPAGAGRIALPFLRGEPLRSFSIARAAYGMRLNIAGRHRGALRAGRTREVELVALGGDARGARPQRLVEGALDDRRDAPARAASALERAVTRLTDRHENRSPHLRRPLRADDRRSHPPRRHRPHRPHRARLHDVRRRGEVRRRQGDSRRHGAVADGDARRRRARSRHHQRRHRRQHRHLQGRRRHPRRPHRRDRQGGQSRASWTA